MEIFLSKKLRYFMVIMETRNFSKAADALCITRSPLSKVISELEQNLGDILFIRKHNELSPTSLAWACYNKCKPFYDSLRSMEDDYKIKANQKPISIIFDISIPELLFRHVEMIAKLEQLYVELKRELITTDTLYNLQHSENHAIISFRELGRSSNIKYNTWEACEVVLLSSQHAKNNNSCNECISGKIITSITLKVFILQFLPTLILNQFLLNTTLIFLPFFILYVQEKVWR